eukprot:Phypoly_transcript_01982.p1 GENE.Phypoly_transcript_01982~~Phypoly_transcript_01982.p1  ORF type:complete len:859 (+),score=142.97 Phypoly_transcript_01982:385-2961(+)
MFLRSLKRQPQLISSLFPHKRSFSNMGREGYKYENQVAPWVDKIKLGGKENAVSQEGVPPGIVTFENHLEANKTLSVDDFKKQYSPEHTYLPKIDFDPTTGKFYDEFTNLAKRKPNSHYAKTATFDMNPAEAELFKKNGFVVIEGSKTNFSREYYRIFNNDLPVFVTADSILHAFHMSYDAALQELETHFFTLKISELLSGMSAQLKGLDDQLQAHGDASILRACCKDADLFITVARNLLASEKILYADFPDMEKLLALRQKEGAGAPKRSGFFQGFFGKSQPAPKPVDSDQQFLEEHRDKTPQIKTVFGDDKAVTDLLKECFEGKQTKLCLFGKDREIDFSQMTPRGHYAKTEQLRRYFRAMMWCGRIDLKVAGEESTTRQLGAAAVLHTLLSRTPGGEQSWLEMNNLLESLVGVPNSMTFPQLGIVLNQTCKLKDCLELDSEEALQKVQAAILETKWGIKAYNSELGDSYGAGKKQLPRSFTLMGQRFALDSWAMSKFVTDQIFWQETKVLRKRTSAIEIAFSVLANDTPVPILAKRLEDTSTKNFRDGLPYQHNLVSARKTIDDLPTESWKSSLYTYWLASLKTLSEPTVDPKYPQAMRTQAYAMKRMNTQLASWAQLRHDNLLYVEPVYDFRCGCSYPAGFVEPLVNFWKSVEDMCLVISAVLEKTPFPASFKDQWGQERHIKRDQVDFFKRFARHVRVLHDISVKELLQQPLEEHEALFLKTITEGVGFMSGMSMWGGWYPELYYGGKGDADEEDLIVGDVFTATPDPLLGDPGCVLHEGLGYPRTMLITVDNGNDKCTYAGPVFTHYEFELKGVERWADKQWEDRVKANNIPPLPEWTAYYSAHVADKPFSP